MAATAPFFPLFMHIPKTAGTTLHYVLRRQYRRTLQTFYTKSEIENPVLKGKAKAAIGHFRIHFAAQLPKNNYRFATFLRDPVSQVFSNFNYVKSNATGNHEAFKDFSLEDFVNHPLGNNLFTRSICGFNPHGKEAEALKTAKENLSNFFFVGVSEEFNAGLLVLQKLMHWRKKPYYLRGTVQKYSVKISEFEKAIIEKNNPLDRELYNYACELWNAQKSTMEIDYRSVKKFEMRNHLYGMLAKKWSLLKNRSPE